MDARRPKHVENLRHCKVIVTVKVYSVGYVIAIPDINITSLWTFNFIIPYVNLSAKEAYRLRYKKEFDSSFSNKQETRQL
jgi:hypothetical protein